MPAAAIATAVHLLTNLAQTDKQINRLSYGNLFLACTSDAFAWCRLIVLMTTASRQ